MKSFEKLESTYSYFVHDQNTPLLISSSLLRKRNMGQIDVSWISKEYLYVAECKSGHYLYHTISKTQLKRLKNSLHFLASLFNKSAKLLEVKSQEEFAKSYPSAYPFKVCKIMELT